MEALAGAFILYHMWRWDVSALPRPPLVHFYGSVVATANFLKQSCGLIQFDSFASNNLTFHRLRLEVHTKQVFSSFYWCCWILKFGMWWSVGICISFLRWALTLYIPKDPVTLVCGCPWESAILTYEIFGPLDKSSVTVADTRCHTRYFCKPEHYIKLLD